MRDIKRIEPILDRLKKVWEKQPDLRLGQLICNVWPDPYYVEDEQLVKDLKHHYYHGVVNTSFGPNDRSKYKNYEPPEPSNNFCLCCSSPAEQYGFANKDHKGKVIRCTREICPPCFESGCTCLGIKLYCIPAEIHVDCEHQIKGPFYEKD